MKIKLTKKFGRLLGWLATDGSVSKTGWFIKFTNKDSHLRKFFSKTVNELFGLEGKEIRVNNRTPEVQVNSSKFVRELITKFKIKNKVELARRIWKTKNKEFILGFLEGLFDGDGSVYINQKYYIRRVDVANKNSLFLHYVKLMLNFVGISCFLTKGRLVIARSHDLLKFYQLINFRHKKRKEKLTCLIKNLSSCATTGRGHGSGSPQMGSET